MVLFAYSLSAVQIGRKDQFPVYYKQQTYSLVINVTLLPTDTYELRTLEL